jgi:PEP-CTERM motif
VFITSTLRDATSSNIADYNTFVDNAAEAVPELALLGDDWKAIASTASVGGPIVNAKTNTSTDPSVLAGVPIYLLNGTKLVDDYADLWDGSIDVRLNVNELGNVVTAGAKVWTGTTAAGIASGAGGNRALGYGTLAEIGVNTYTTPDWIFGGRESVLLTRKMYAISSVMTVVPEPTTAVLFGLGLAGLAARRK